MSQIFTVSALSENIRHCVEGHFPFVWVKGEVCNVSRPSSGHVYFSLKDAQASLPCVWFRGQQRAAESFDQLTGEVFSDGPRPSLAQSIENGQQIMCAGRITSYAQRGVYQLFVELAQDAGLGQLFAAFEAMKARLAARGFFAEARKRPLPHNPLRVAVVTSPSGAVIHDFLRIAENRGLSSSIHIYPVPVQGVEAALAIARVLRHINDAAWAEVIVLLRGGGSLEDLWAFNEEVVAEAVFTSRIPVLAGIGHEVDVSMADLTADVRAATPSHAAQLLWTPRTQMLQDVDNVETALHEAMQEVVTKNTSIVQIYTKALAWLSPWQVIARNESQLQRLQQDIVRVMSHALYERGVRQERLQLRLDACNPYAPLQKGYVLLQNTAKQSIRSIQQVRMGEQLHVVLHDGHIDVQAVRLHPKQEK